MKNINKLLKKLVEIKSFSGEEIQICNYVFNLLKEEGFKVQKIPVDNKGFNIVAKVGTPKIFFATHMDTVKESLPIKENKDLIFGRGSCDAKASLSTMISAAIQCKNDQLSNFGLMFTVGEEKDFRGAKEILKKKIKAPFIIVGEPTSLNLVNGHFGILELKIITKGKKAHSSEPGKGINAIDKLLRALKAFKKIKTNKKSFFSVCKINGGIASNIIPNYAEATISFRISPNDATKYFEKSKKVLKGLAIVKKILEINSVITKIPKELSFIGKPRIVKYGTELSLYRKGVVLGPGNIKFAHSDNENIKKKELEKAIKIYKEIISNYNQ